MITAKNVWSFQGEPLTLTLRETHEHAHAPVWLYVLQADLPDEVMEGLAADMRTRAIEYAIAMGVDEDEAEERVDEMLEGAEIAPIIEEPFPICWN